MPMPDISISVIIPCWQDEARLGQLLTSLHQLPRRSEQSLQIIVVDAARSEECNRLCQQHGAQWLPAAPCRGEQLRLGAQHARHSTLWFLHADAQIQGNPLPDIRKVIRDGAVGGYFTFSFAGTDCWQTRLLQWLINWRVRYGIPYGDQGLFVEANAYRVCGQHSPSPLFEEVALVQELRRLGHFVRVEQGVKVDPRRWVRDGWWLRSAHNRLLVLAHVRGVPALHLARRYTQHNTSTRPPAER